MRLRFPALFFYFYFFRIISLYWFEWCQTGGFALIDLLGYFMGLLLYQGVFTLAIFGGIAYSRYLLRKHNLYNFYSFAACFLLVTMPFLLYFDYFRMTGPFVLSLFDGTLDQTVSRFSGHGILTILIGIVFCWAQVRVDAYLARQHKEV